MSAKIINKIRDPVLDRLPGRLQALRRGAQLTQKELGELCNLPRKKIILFELGAREPSLSELLNICRALNYGANYVLGISRSARPTRDAGDSRPIGMES